MPLGFSFLSPWLQPIPERPVTKPGGARSGSRRGPCEEPASPWALGSGTLQGDTRVDGCCEPSRARSPRPCRPTCSGRWATQVRAVLPGARGAWCPGAFRLGGLVLQRGPPAPALLLRGELDTSGGPPPPPPLTSAMLGFCFCLFQLFNPRHLLCLSVLFLRLGVDCGAFLSC